MRSAARQGRRRSSSRPSVLRLGRPPAAAGLLLLTLAGCDADGASEPRATPRAIAQQWAQDVNAGELEAACRVMETTREPCPAVLDELTEPPLVGLAPHSVGRPLPEGHEAFSLEGRSGSVVIVVAGGGAVRPVRLEATILR